ncbi:winged helix-turn-helix transcriptional regulator [Oceanicaulis sp. LC35]|uniref:winged helix-turn-helix transcriptional regulator n=1 Tax=Oceanicaulis sp. LC35 TaxID=3349635 RepID=UPI003F85E217
MTRTSLSRYPCPVARAVDVIGDPWCLLVLRDAIAGVRRFSDFRDRLGVSAKILTDRLNRLVDQDVLERQETNPGKQRFEYELTAKGRELAPALIALMQWGERWTFEPGRSPVRLSVRDTGEALAPIRLETATGREVQVDDLEMSATEAAPDITKHAYAALKARANRNKDAQT